MIYRFAECEFDPGQHSVLRAGQRHQLPPKVFRVLQYLIEHRERTISKDELCEHIWDGQAISDSSIESCMRTVRNTVGDHGHPKRVIQTQRGYGYRFIARVEMISEPGIEARGDTPGTPEPLSVAPSPVPPLPVPGIRACRACHQVNTVEALFCIACGVRLLQPCPHCGQEGTAPDAFCAACGQPCRPATPPATDGPAAGTPEHKPVTVLCCALPTLPLDRETYQTVFLKLHEHVQDLARAYGGYLYPVVGAHFLLLFGVPLTQEDGAQRAVRVAWELRQRLHQVCALLGLLAEVPLALRIGLHTGLGVVGSLPAPEEAGLAPTLVGDVVGVATALQERATPGMIVCSDATARLIESCAHLERVACLPLPGHAASLATYAVQSLSPHLSPVAQRLQRVLSPFVGRESEMALLQTALTHVESGRGQVVGIVGEAGLGKSRLLYEFRQRLEPARYTYVTGQCLSYATTTPYLAVLDLLRHTCGLRETDGPEVIRAQVQAHLADRGLAIEAWTPVLLYLLNVREGAQPIAALRPDVRRARILTALTQLWLHSTAQRPLILEVENVHWLDASSAECLRDLIERMAGVPLLLLMTYRPGYHLPGMGSSHIMQVPLHPLTAAASRQVVQATLPTTAHQTTLESQLVAKADGNPFFLEELARTVLEQGTTRTEVTVPDTVQAVLQARIDRLPLAAKRLLHVAAVLGKEGMVSLLHAVAEVPETTLAEGLQHLRGAEFLYETYTPMDQRYTFKHALTQEVAYQTMMRQARQAWHARVVQVVETQFRELGETQPEFLAHHCTEAGLTRQAIAYWHRAGVRAVERSANAEALSHFERGLQLVATLPQTRERLHYELDLRLASGPPLLMLKAHTALEVRQTYTQAYTLAQQLDDPAQRFAVLVGLWRYYLSEAQLGTAGELAEEALQLAATLPEAASRQEAHLMVGSTAFFQGQRQTARVHLEQGAALQDAQCGRTLAVQRGTAPGVVSLARLAWTLWQLGYPDQARQRSREAIALAQALAHPYSLTFALLYDAHLHGWCGQVAETRAQMEVLLPAMRAQGFVQFVGGGLMRYGWALVAQGEVLEGIAQMREGLATQDTYGVALGHHEIWAVLAWAYGQAGESTAGFAALDQAMTLAQSHGEYYWLPELHRLYGELHWQNGCPGDAEACFQRARTLAHQHQAKAFELRSVLSLSRLWHAQGQHATAHQCLAEVYGWFTEGFDTQDLQEAQTLLTRGDQEDCDGRGA